jgi:hypothetical protein
VGGWFSVLCVDGVMPGVGALREWWVRVCKECGLGLVTHALRVVSCPAKIEWPWILKKVFDLMSMLYVWVWVWVV